MKCETKQEWKWEIWLAYLASEGVSGGPFPSSGATSLQQIGKLLWTEH